VHDTADMSTLASVERHLALSPVAFAVTEGPGHVVQYANAAFRRLQAAGEIAIGIPVSIDHPQTSELIRIRKLAERVSIDGTKELIDGSVCQFLAGYQLLLARQPTPAEAGGDIGPILCFG